MWGGQLLAWGGPGGLQGGGCGVCGMGVGGGRTGEPRTSTLLICCRMWHCCPSPPALRSLSSIAESSPCATLEQKASGPWMNSLWGRGAGWAQSKARSSMGMKGVRAFLPPQRRELCVTAGGGSKAGCTHRTPLPKAFPRVHPAAARPPPPTHRAPPTPTWSSRSHPAHPPPSGHRPHGAASAPLLPLTPTWVGMDPPPRRAQPPPRAARRSPGLVLQPLAQDAAQTAGELCEDSAELLRRHLGDDAPEGHGGKRHLRGGDAEGSALCPSHGIGSPEPAARRRSRKRRPGAMPAAVPQFPPQLRGIPAPPTQGDGTGMCRGGLGAGGARRDGRVTGAGSEGGSDLGTRWFWEPQPLPCRMGGLSFSPYPPEEGTSRGAPTAPADRRPHGEPREVWGRHVEDPTATPQPSPHGRAEAQGGTQSEGKGESVPGTTSQRRPPGGGEG